MTQPQPHQRNPQLPPFLNRKPVFPPRRQIPGEHQLTAIFVTTAGCILFAGLALATFKVGVALGCIDACPPQNRPPAVILR